MKGLTLFSDTFLIFALIAVALLFSAFLWAVTMTYTTLGPQQRYVTMNLIDMPIENDGAFLAFLECTVDTQSIVGLGTTKVPMKTLIMQAVAKGDVTLNGANIEAEKLLKEMFPNRNYLLMVNNPELIFAKSKEPSGSLNRVSTILFLSDKKTTLELYTW